MYHLQYVENFCILPAQYSYVFHKFLQKTAIIYPQILFLSRRMCFVGFNPNLILGLERVNGTVIKFRFFIHLRLKVLRYPHLTHSP
jgi:hypothetical protein